MSTATKIDLVEGLVDAGLKQVEVTSFVSPKWVPQLADAAQVCEGISREDSVKYPVLVPNLKASIKTNCCASHPMLHFVIVIRCITYFEHNTCRVSTGHLTPRQLKSLSSQQLQSSSARETPIAAFKRA